MTSPPKTWAARRIENASWIAFIIWFVLLFAYSTWAFNMDSPWTRALEAGGGMLPETQAGYPPIEPQRSLSALGDAKSDYILWQALDIPYALMNLFVTMIAMALGLKALRLGGNPLRFVLYLPVIYVACEIVENAFVAAFASGLAPAEPLVLLQQTATTVKFASGFGSLGLGALGLVVAVVAALIRFVRKKA